MPTEEPTEPVSHMDGRVVRYDLCELLPLAPPEKRKNGWIKVEGRIARVGLQEYEDADGGKHVELRLPEEVFKPESLKSFQMVPVTNLHPPGLLDDKNTATYQVGQAGEDIRRAGDYVVAPLMLTNDQAITHAKAGRIQLSNGYTCRLDPHQDDALTKKWGHYDFLQRDIEGNHIAMVDTARAGPNAEIRLDSRSARMVQLVGHPTEPERVMPQSVRIDGIPYEISDASASALQAAIEKQSRDAKEKMDAAVQQEKTRADAAVKRLAAVRQNGLTLLGKIDEIRAASDASRARMVTCDECNGTGKVKGDSEGDKQETCDYCDGKGKYRMHDAVAALPLVESEDAVPDVEDVLEEFRMDAEDLDTEHAAETDVQKGQRDRKRADAAKRHKVEAKKAKDRLAASLGRRVDRAIRDRVAMEGKARKYLGQEADIASLDAIEIQKKVIEKLCPGAKLDGKTPEQIAARYDAEVERADSAPSAADLLRQGTSPFARVVPSGGNAGGGGGGGFVGTVPRGRAAMLAQHADAQKKATGQK